jgi:cell wall-associated NlpC family hydrolase
LRAGVSGLAISALLLTGYLGSAAHATPNPVPSYPSQAEVDAAKNNVTKKKAVIAKLQDVLTAQSEQEAKLQRAAAIKAEAYNQARDKVVAIAAKVKRLQAKADAAAAKAKAAKTEIGQIAAQMYRNGGTGTTTSLLLDPHSADGLLYKLGTQERLASQSGAMYNRAVQQQNLAHSITAELATAKSELATQAQTAKTAYASAQAADNELSAKVAYNNRLSKTFYAQLASLQNISADLAKQRADGLAAEARQNAVKTPPAVAPELYTVGDADAGKVDTALAFARAQLGEHYVLGGMGPDVWDCSGITKAAYAAAGIDIGTHSATNQFLTMAAERKLVPLNQLQVGDLMWYSQSSSFNGDKYHVVIYVGNGMMLEAPNPARVVRIVPIRYGELFPYAGRPTATS